MQGSRDPLGILPIWSRLGRRIIKNVTTVSGDLRGWTTLIVCMGLVEDLRAGGVLKGRGDEAFLRAEQLIAYARTAAAPKDGDPTGVPRGVTRVRARLAEFHRGPLRVGTSRDRRILSAQRTAGVFGQIAAAAEASRLLDRSRFELTGARPLWNALRITLEPHHKQVVKLLTDSDARFDPTGPLAQALAGLHRAELTALEAAVYERHIAFGDGPPDGDQTLLATLWSEPHINSEPDLLGVAGLAQRARDLGHDSLAEKLTAIRKAEHLLATCEILFTWLLGLDRAPTVAVAARELGQAMGGTSSLLTEADDELLGAPALASYGSVEWLTRMATLRDALMEARWEDCVRGAVELNGWVMERRGGAPWIEVVGDRLEIRLAGDHGPAPTAADVPRRMRHSYYLDPHRRLVRAIRRWRT